MATFNPRKLMTQAIEVMRQSVNEKRTDAKASPLVGALLWKPDRTIETACRGELRAGDHAEYSLLERKNRDQRLDGSILFATLEPCAPGSRSHPKLSCAERIVLARIKKVWVGIADPDPTVDRKGIKYLQDNGVEVEMFDLDLQEEIQKGNERFIAQANERAATAREDRKAKPVVLSSHENAFASADVDDFSKDALERYRAAAKIEGAVGSQVWNRRMVQLGILKEGGGHLIPTGFGLLLFGKDPRAAMPQAGLLGTIHYADGTEELRDFAGPQILAPEAAMEWLRDKLPNAVSRTSARRRELNSPLFELVRESVVNALVHRDYAIEGAKSQLIVTPDTIVVRSPGAPVEPITLEQLQSLNAPMLSRNPILHYVFAKMEMAEERGLGLKSMKARAEEAGLPLPSFKWEEPYLALTLYRTAASAVSSLPGDLKERLNADARASWEYVSKKPVVTTQMLMGAMEFDERKAQRVLKWLFQAGLLRKLGKGPATRYQVIRK